MTRRASEPELSLLTQVHWAKVAVPQAEYRFHDTRRWRFDFAWPDVMVACEIEGGRWTQGAHVRGAHFESDLEKYNEAALLGWLLIRVTPEMVEDGRALKLIERALVTRIQQNWSREHVVAQS